MNITRSSYQTPRLLRRPVRNSNKRLRDWAAEDAASVQRGRIDIYIAPDAFARPAHNRAAHRPKKYPDALFHLAMIVRKLDHKAYRPLEGRLFSLARLCGYVGDTPDHVTIWRRIAELALPPLPRPTGPRTLVVDSTGVKLFGAGEWRVSGDRERIERTYLKLHQVKDAESGEILDWALTNRDGYGSGDSLVGGWMIERLVGEGVEINAVAGDGAYDGRSFRKPIADAGGRALVPPKKNSLLSRARNRDYDPEAWQLERDEQIFACREGVDGRENWKIASGYHVRSLAETGFSRYKTVLGAGMRSRIPEQQRLEIAYGVWLLNEIAIRSTA